MKLKPSRLTCSESSRKEARKENRREADARVKEISRLRESPELEDKILAVIASRDWYRYQAYMIPWDDKDGTVKHLARFFRKGKFPLIINPGSEHRYD